jgi:hypothetical protein
MPQTPEEERPISTVPNTGAGKDDEQIAVGHELAVAIATQRNIQIFFEPSAQGNMPTMPEFRNAGADIGIIEVL